MLDTKSIETAIANLEANKQNNLTAGAGISITDNGVISSDVGLKMIVLGDGEELPSPYEGEENTIYFKRNTTEEESDDRYEEYILVDSGFELIGTTKVDLSAYAQKTELPTKTSDLHNDSGYITADDVPPEVYIGSEEPQGNEVIWVDNSTNPENINATKAYVDEKVSSKQDAPKEQGTSGQVLGLNDELQIQWQDPRPSRIIAEATTTEEVSSISFTNLDLSNVTEIFITFSTPSDINFNGTNGELIIKSNGISASSGVAFNGWRMYNNKLSLISVKKINNIIVWDYYQNKPDSSYWWTNNGTLYRRCSNSNIEFGKNSTINITLWGNMFPKGFTVKIGVIE